MRRCSNTVAATALLLFAACSAAPARTPVGTASAQPTGSSSATVRGAATSEPNVSTPDAGDGRASADSSAPVPAPAPALDDAARCGELRRAATLASKLSDLRTALADQGSRLGISVGESVEVGKQLLSFCVGVTPEIAAGPCVTALGLERPLAYRVPGQRKWTIASAALRPGERMRAPRHGPAAILPMLLKAPHGRILSNTVGTLGSSDANLSIHELAATEDVIGEVCFVDRTLGEGK